MPFESRFFGVALKALGTLHEAWGYLLANATAVTGWVAAFGAAAGVALGYYLAARLGLALLSPPADVAAFWPASGIAAGIFILSTRRFRPAFVVGVIVGTVAANLMSDRTVWTSLFKGFCNAGEAVLVAGLIERWFGRPFAFDNLRRVLGFATAACLGTAASGFGGAATITLLHTAAPFWSAWRAWFLSDAVGILMVAPLMIGLGEAWRKPPSRAECIEAAGVLSLLTVIICYAVTHPTGSWLSFDPDAVVLPLLLWLTARTKPVFGIAGAFIVSLTVIVATTFGIGHLGDAAVPLGERVGGAQVVITMVTLYTLVLAALFAQRNDAEDGLRKSENQLARKSVALTRLHEASSRLWRKRDLRMVLDEILAGAIELQAADMGHIQLLDPNRRALEMAAHRGISREVLDLIRQVSTANGSVCRRALQFGTRIVIGDVEADARYEPFRSAARLAGYRAVQSTPIMSSEGKPLGILCTHFRSTHQFNDEDLRLLDLYVRLAADIIERHQTDEVLRTSEERLRLAQLKTGIGIWDWDLRTGKVTWTPELEAIFGLEPGTVKTYADFRDRVHPGDIDRVEAERDDAVHRRDQFNVEFRVIRSDGAVRWILSTGAAIYDEESGEPMRILGNNLDITHRKLAELALAERNAQFELAGKTARVGSFAIDYPAALVTLSPGCAAILGLPESAIEISRDSARRLVHPEDLTRLDAPRDHAFRNKQREFLTQFRIIRAGDAEVRWVETRSMILYDQGGQPLSLIAVIIDITERKLGDQALDERNAQLALAGKVGRVGSYAYDVNAETLQVSEGYAALHGLPEGTTETTLSEWRARVHPEDLGHVEAVRNRAVVDKRREYNVEYRIVLSDGQMRWIERRCIIAYDGHDPQRVVGVTIDITERKQAERQRNTLNAELDHRVKNVLATVGAIVFHTKNANSTIEDFVASVDRRIKSLAGTHELLSDTRWHGAALREILRREFSPYTADQYDISGPNITLKPEAAQAMAMVLHELTTNAAKYGALSNRAGRVLVRWFWLPKGKPRQRLAIEWQETDGPSVSAPTAFGYGTSIIRELLPYEFAGTVDLAFAHGGVRCRLEIPADWASSGGIEHRTLH